MPLLHRGAQDHVAADAGDCRLRPCLKRWDLNHEVIARVGAAREPPPLTQLVGVEGAWVDGADRDLALDYPDLALLACAMATTRGVDRDPVPARGVEHRRPARHADLRALGEKAQPDAAGAVLRRRRFVGTRPWSGQRSAHRAAASSRSAASRSATCRSAACRARCAPIQLAPHGSWPRSRSAPRTACTHTSAVDMIALVRPAAIAIGRNAALRTCRCGRPNDTFEAPRHMFTPSSSRIRLIVLSVVVTASVSAPTVIASGSITTSSAAMPWSPAASMILRAHSSRFSGVSGIPVSSLASPITAAP